MFRPLCILITTMLCAALVDTSASAAQKSSKTHLPTLTSDEPDYGPGSTALLSGSGFLPNEIVTMRVVHADGTPSTGENHDPWTVTANGLGRFITSWHVCEDDCVNQLLRATADGASSGLHAQTTFTDSHVCGTGVVVSIVPVGGSCVAFTPAVGSGPDNYEVADGGTYTMTISGVTECSGDTITVFIQNSSTGNYCFNATGGSGTYSGTFTTPDPGCNTSPVSYKCGASAACSHSNSFAAQGPTSGCGGVHLRASNFDASCVKTGDDTDCSSTAQTGACCLDANTCVEVTEEECLAMGGIYRGDSIQCADQDCSEVFPGCTTTFTLDFETDDMGNTMAHGAKVDTEYDGGPSFPVTITGSVNVSGANTAAILNSTTGPAMQDPDLLVGKGNILILQTDADLSECPPASGIYCTHNDDENGGTLSFAFNVLVSPQSITLIDIDATDPTSMVVLTDSNGLTRTYTVPANWTGDKVTDGPPGYGTLSLVTLANQAGFGSTATAGEQAGFNPDAVIQLDVHLGGSGAVDDLSWCQ